MRYMCMLLLLLCAVVSAWSDEAIPFQYEPLTSADITRPVRVAMDGTVAAVIENGFADTSGNLKTYHYDGTNWSEFGILPAPGVALSVDVDNCFMAVGKEGQIDVWVASCGGPFKPIWGVLTNIVFTNSSLDVVSVDLDLPHLAAVVKDTSFSLGPTTDFVYIYEIVGGAWVLRAMRSVELDSGGFGTSHLAEGIDLDGSRLALSYPRRNIIQIHEQSAGGANNWGLVASISNEPPGYTELGYSLALDGNRLAATALASSFGEPVLLVYSNNTGGAGNWGHAGTLLSSPPDTMLMSLDADNGRLAVFGLPALDSLYSSGQAGKLWIYDQGAGPAGWMLEKSLETGPANWALSSLFGSSLAFGLAHPSLAGDMLWVGVGDSNTFGEIDGTILSVHEESAGGSGQWGTAHEIKTEGPPDRFGFSVDMDGNYLVTGMPYGDGYGTNSGSAYVWYRSDFSSSRAAWFPVARLTSPTPGPSDFFGFDVAVDMLDSGNARIAVGAWGEFVDKGAVYIFEVSPNFGQLEPAIRIAPLPYSAHTWFGYSVDIDDDYLAVGAPISDIAGVNRGAVYIFDKDFGGVDNWGCRATNAPAPSSDIFFGRQVRMQDSVMLASDPGEAVHVYLRNEGGLNVWGEESVITPPGGTAIGYGFGWSMDIISANSILVGANYSSSGTNRGEAFLFLRNTSGVFTAFLTLKDPQGDGRTFGTSVDWIDSGGILVGAPQGGMHTGGVMRLYQPVLAGGLTSAVLVASLHGDQPGDRLGEDVAGSGIFMAGGAQNSDTNGADGGMVKTMRVGSYEIWAGSQPGGFASAWLPWENWDGDPDKNLMEFAMGTDPMNGSDYSRLYMWPYYPSSPVTMAWEKPDLPYSTLFLDYNIRISDDVSDWRFVSYDTISTNGTTWRLYDTPGFLQQYRMEPRYPMVTPSGGGIIILD